MVVSLPALMLMDLKMGTRMYSDLATETKMLSQRRKSSRTTSSSLGLRWAGIGGELVT